MNHINFFKYFSEKNKNKNNASSASVSAEPITLPIQKKELKSIFSFKNSKKNKNRIKKETEENVEQNCKINKKHNTNKMLNTNLYDKNINEKERNHQEVVLTNKTNIQNIDNTDTTTATNNNNYNSNNNNNKYDKHKWIQNINMNNEQIKNHTKNTHLLKKIDKKNEIGGEKEFEKERDIEKEKESEKEKEIEKESEREREREKGYGREEHLLNCEYEKNKFSNSKNKDEKLKNLINFSDETKQIGVKENKNQKNKLFNMFFTKRNKKNEKQKFKEDSILKINENSNDQYQERENEKEITKEITKEIPKEIPKEMVKEITQEIHKDMQKEKKRIFENKDILFDSNNNSTELKHKINNKEPSNYPIFYSNNIYYNKNKMNPENVKMQTSVKKENSCDVDKTNNPKEENTNVDNRNVWNNYIKYLDKNFHLNGNKLLHRRSLSGEAVNRNDIMSVDNKEPISSSAHTGTTLKRKENKKQLINSSNQLSNSQKKFNFFNYNNGKDTQTNGTNAPDVVLTRNEYIKWLQKQNQLLQKNTNTYFKDNMANCFMNANNEFVTRNKYNLAKFTQCVDNNNINNNNNVYINNNSESNTVMNTSHRSNARQKRRSISLTDRNNVDIGPQHFMFLKVIGKGSYGKVLLVKYMKDNKLYAMKILRKDNIATKSQLEHTQIERNVLKNVVHPFIVKLYYAFQTSTKLYFILEYCPGGELFFHLSKFKEFSEEIVKFYAAEVILALQYLHEMDIIYRDLKPENILLDEQGHIRLTDFGLSKDGIKDNFSATSLCGTPEYLAPEIISQTGHGKAVDWWSLGIMIFEMLTGSLPFNSSNRKVLFDRITYTELHYPKRISPTAVDLLKKLFEKNPRKRLGSGKTDAAEIKSHPFFKNVNWDAVLQKKIKPPFKPPLFDKNDMQNFDKEFLCMALRHSDQFDNNTCTSNRKKYVHLSGFNYACEQPSSKQ